MTEPQTTFTACAEPDCVAQLADHKWGHVKAKGWFEQRDGTIWCPEHNPPWVVEWRARKAAERARREAESEPSS